MIVPCFFFEPVWAGLSCRQAHRVQIQNLLSSHARQTLERHREDTVAGLEALRGRNGLLVDTAWVKNRKDGSRRLVTLNPDTSPTNVAVDLLVQIERLQNIGTRSEARKKLSDLLGILDQVEFHQDTGLFFSRYSSATEKPVIKDSCVSSIDNLHLAIALWTLHQQEPQSQIGKKAGELFARMDFSVYYNPEKGLIGGNLREHQGQWHREAYDLANLGSEGRLLYSVGWSLGLFRNITNEKTYLTKAFDRLTLEFHQSPEGKLLKLWDGSAFQLYFPRIFANENLYSSTLKQVFINMGNYMIGEGQRQGLMTPAGFNAIRVGTHEALFQGSGSIYRDKAGNPDLVSTDNHDVHEPILRENWDATAAPSAMVMAAAASPATWAPILKELEKIKSADSALYLPGLGWTEGVHIKGVGKDQVVASQLSLNQGMIALSLFQMTSADGLSASARALYNNPQVREKLQKFYQMFDHIASQQDAE
ncbi:MAG: hypothetical protein ACXWC9_02850 [Pseudobdellovibrionaceae bacterium]